MTDTQDNQIQECERDGFPILELNGEPHCLAEFVNFCIGRKKIIDVVLRSDTLYYVFENRHELPLLCYCCGQPLAGYDLQLERQQMRGRRLESMSWAPETLEDGRVVIDYQLEFSSKHGETEPLILQTSVQSAARMVHPLLCAHSGIPLPDNTYQSAAPSPTSNRKRKRR